MITRGIKTKVELLVKLVDIADSMFESKDKKVNSEFWEIEEKLRRIKLNKSEKNILAIQAERINKAVLWGRLSY